MPEVDTDRHRAEPVPKLAATTSDAVERAGREHEDAHLRDGDDRGVERRRRGVGTPARDRVDERYLVAAEGDEAGAHGTEPAEQHEPDAPLVEPRLRAPPCAEHPRHAPHDEEPDPTDPTRPLGTEAQNIEHGDGTERAPDRGDGPALRDPRQRRADGGERQIGGEEPQRLGRESGAGAERARVPAEQADRDHGNRPCGHHDRGEPDEATEPRDGVRERARRVGPSRRREEQGHRSGDREPRVRRVQGEDVRSAKAAAVPVDHGHREVAEHHHHQGKAAGVVDRRATFGRAARSNRRVHDRSMCRRRLRAYPGQPPNSSGGVYSMPCSRA